MTQHEAELAWLRQPRLETGETYQYVWIPPPVTPPRSAIRTAFRKVAVAEFADYGRVAFQRAGFAVVGGFTGAGTEGPADFSAARSRFGPYRFFVLEVPARLEYVWDGRAAVADIAVGTGPAAAGGSVPVVLLSGAEPAVTVTPADEHTAEVFNATAELDDKAGALRHHVNIGQIRWLRPAQLKVLEKL